MKRALLVLLALLLLGVAWLVYRLNDHPNLAAYEPRRLVGTAEAQGGRVDVTFLGVSTLLISDAETSILTDGFFSRPGKLASLLGRIEPDRERIAATLRRAGAERLAAVLVVHSHYDHAMDAPEVARRTGAVMVGSPSTANIARGDGLQEAQIRVVEPGVPMRFGSFTVTMIPSLHFPHGMAMGEIEEPLVPPVRATDYKEGGSYSVLVEHPLGNLLVQGSAGWVEGALAGRQADVVLLGIGGLGTRDEEYMEGYYRNVVEPLGVRCVVPIHWDDFTLPLDVPLRPFPKLLDDVDASLQFLAQRTAAAGVGLGLLPAWEKVTLLGAGAAPCS